MITVALELTAVTAFQYERTWHGRWSFGIMVCIAL